MCSSRADGSNARSGFTAAIACSSRRPTTASFHGLICRTVCSCRYHIDRRHGSADGDGCRTCPADARMMGADPNYDQEPASRRAGNAQVDTAPGGGSAVKGSTSLPRASVTRSELLEPACRPERCRREEAHIRPGGAIQGAAAFYWDRDSNNRPRLLERGDMQVLL